MEAWNLIIKDAQSRRIDESRATFERLVTYFPTSGRFWKIYIEQEVAIESLLQLAALQFF